jgi:hypothetical protein
MPSRLVLLGLVARLAAASYAWARSGTRLAAMLAVASAVWSVSWGARGTRADPSPLATRAPVVAVDVSLRSSGVGAAEASWEEPRKVVKDRHLLGHALLPLLAESPRVLGPHWRATRPVPPSGSTAVVRWRSERAAVPAPRGPPVG